MKYYISLAIPLGLVISLIFIIIVTIINGAKVESILPLINLIVIVLIAQLCIIKLVFIKMNKDYKQSKKSKKNKNMINKKLIKSNINIFNKISFLKYNVNPKKQFLVTISFTISIIIVIFGLSLLNNKRIVDIRENVIQDISIKADFMVWIY